ncbi:PIN domain-containing protein [bacterium]|nr:MAG: PIN domain-containing protein [bacterium]
MTSSSHSNPNLPISIFLDTTFLLDLIVPGRGRKSAADDVVKIFNKYEGTGEFFVYTSLWNITEAHGTLYEERMGNNGFTTSRNGYPNPKRLRDYIPPETLHLSDAQSDIEQMIQDLENNCLFQVLSLPRPNAFELANRLSVQYAIWPADSIHLAFALSEACTLFISDDGDLLDKIECAASFVLSYQANEFSHISAPAFNAVGLHSCRSRLASRASAPRQTALDALLNLGFT